MSEEAEKNEVDNSRPAIFKNLAHECACVLICTLAVASASISTGSFQISLHAISEHFNVTGGRLPWSTSSISLANGSLLLLTGKIGDIFGRKNCIVFGFVGYAVSSLICGFMQHSFVALCVMRAIMGVFLAFSVPTSGGLLASLYPISVRKNRAMACFSAGAPLGMIGGLIIGGICVTVLNWMCIQWFLAIVYGFVAVFAAWLLPNDAKLNWRDWSAVKQNYGSKLKKVDYVGAVLITAALTLIVFALNQNSVPSQGWATPYIIVTLVVGVVLLVVFVVYESYVPRVPLMPMFVWKNRNFALAMAVVWFSWMGFGGVMSYYSTVYFEQIRGYSALETTVRILAMGVCGALVNVVAAMILHLIPGTLILEFATCSFTACFIVWATISEKTSYWRGPFEGLCLGVIGADLTFNVVNMICINSVDKKNLGSAQGIFQTITQLSVALGLGLSSTVIAAKYPEYNDDVPLSDHARISKKFESLKYAYYFALGCSVTAMLLSLFIRAGKSGDNSDMQKKKEYDLQNQENYERQGV